MMYLLKYKPLAVLLSGLLVFAACKKDSNDAPLDGGPDPDPAKDSVYAKPVVDPLTVSAAKPGDTLIIRGTNFSSVASQDTVKFNGVTGTVVSATIVSNTPDIVIELKVVIPASATTGAVTVTVHNNTVEVGSIVVAPLTFYVIKGVYGIKSEFQLITMDPKTGSESLVVSVGPDRINYVVYLPATNEILSLNDDGDKMLKVNVTTKQVTSLTLTTSNTIEYGDLVVDRSNNLYAVKYETVAVGHKAQTLVKLDPKTGNTTAIKSFEHDNNWENLIYNPATNDVVGLIDAGARLFKVSLTTKDTSSVNLSKSPDFEYRALVTDDKSNLYGYKGWHEMSHGDQLFKLNTVTGQETLFVNLPANGKINDKITFVSSYNEFITTWNQYGLLRVNLATLGITPLVLVTDYSKTYDDFTSN